MATTRGSKANYFILIMQPFSLKEPFKMKTAPATEAIDLSLVCFLPPLPLFSIPLLPAGEYWQSVRDSAATVDLSYLQAQRQRVRRDSDSEAVRAIASLSMGSFTSDR